MITEELKQSCLAFAKNPVVNGCKWKDITTYSQDTKEEIPHVFETCVGRSRIVITCNHRDYPNEWIFSCYGLNFTKERLKTAVTPEDAAKQAFDICFNYVESLYHTFKVAKNYQPNK